MHLENKHVLRKCMQVYSIASIFNSKYIQYKITQENIYRG